MRLVDESNQQLKLDDLGFREKEMKKIESAISKPHGMVLIT